MNFVFNQSGEGNTQIGSVDKASLGWVKTADRLPERPEYDWVLVAPLLIPEGYYGVPKVAELRNAVWYSSDIPIEEMCGVKVTHWMPLPKLPEVEG